jgi:hypothetical protein
MASAAVGLLAEPLAQAEQLVLTEIVILIKYGDLRIGNIFADVAAVNAALETISGQPGHRPWKVFGVVPGVGTGNNEQLWHLPLVHITANCEVGRGAKRTEQQQNLLSLDQLARHFDGLRRAVAVIAADEVDLAAVHTALVVDHGEVGRLRFANGGVAGSRPAIGHYVANLDLRIGNSRTVLFFCGHRSSQRGEQQQQCRTRRCRKELLPFAWLAQLQASRRSSVWQLCL